MKRHHLRQDKTCLNCGAVIQERYCSHCGQENTEPKESFSHLIGHFLADVTHFDSKFFVTIKDLIFRPGFLTKQYIAGKRTAYLNPIRMYVFISALFFLVIFSQTPNENKNSPITTANRAANYFRQHLADSLRKLVKTTGLSPVDKRSNEIYSSMAARLDTTLAMTDSSESVGADINNAGIITFHLQENKYATRSEYDAEQRRLPDSARDDRITRYMVRKIILLTHERGHTPGLIVTRNIEHDIPKIMLVLLPLFALFVSFFYSRKKFVYAQHAIFSLHFHSFVFIFLMLEGWAEGLLPMDKMWLIYDRDNIAGHFYLFFGCAAQCLPAKFLVISYKGTGRFDIIYHHPDSMPGYDDCGIFCLA